MPIIGANFTEHQTQHVEIMRKIARSFNESPMVLKGGTALLLAYGLDRYSEDLDFDSTKPINPITRISQAVRATHFKIENIQKR
jgi:predicted nucleotidyltransferase component of viral defense system